MKRALLLLSLVGILFVGILMVPASVHAVACPTIASGAYDAPGFNCQLGSLVTSGPTPLVSGLPQAVLGNSSESGAQNSSVTDTYCSGATAMPGCTTGAGQVSVSNPPPVFGNVAFFGPQFMVALSKETLPDSGVKGQGPLNASPLTSAGGATPEPTSLVLLGSGLIVLGGAAFRSYRRRQVQTS
jgi:hypothetical protein